AGSGRGDADRSGAGTARPWTWDGGTGSTSGDGGTSPQPMITLSVYIGASDRKSRGLQLLSVTNLLVGLSAPRRSDGPGPAPGSGGRRRSSPDHFVSRFCPVSGVLVLLNWRASKTSP